MSGFDENIVREYFELNGFFVRKISKFSSKPKGRSQGNLIDFEICNSRAPESLLSQEFQLFANDIPLLRNATVLVKGWNDSRFTPAILKSNAKTYDFLKRDFGGKSKVALFSVDREEDDEQLNYVATNVLVLPHMPTADPYRVDSIEFLKGLGVERVITFTTILEYLLRSVDVNPSYQRSSVLQFIRVLKIYDMVQEPQMQLFGN